MRFSVPILVWDHSRGCDSISGRPNQRLKLPAPARWSSGFTRSAGAERQRQHEPERAAHPLLALHADSATVGLHRQLAVSQSQPARAPCLLHSSNLPELLEDDITELRWNAGPGVLD